MPPRLFCLLIVAGWLSVTGWLVWKEVGSALETDQPPPFTIDLVMEAQPDREWIRWKVYLADDPPRELGQNEPGVPLRPRYFATTGVAITEKPDIQYTFSLKFEASARDVQGMDLGKLRLHRMNSIYRVDRDARLLAMEAEFAFDYHEAIFGKAIDLKDAAISLKGEVRNRVFHSKYHLEVGPHEWKGELAPVPLAQHGYVLLPLHPVNKLLGLQHGQTWRMRIANPVADALAAWLGGDGPSETRRLVARVRPHDEMLPDVSKAIPCLVIDYEEEGDGDKTRPRTWIRAADGLVLRQEAEMGGKRLVMQRDIIPDPVEK